MSIIAWHSNNNSRSGTVSLPSGAQAFYNFATANALLGGVNLTLAASATLQNTGGVTFVQRGVTTSTANISATVGNVTAPRDPFALGGTAFTLAARVRWSAFDNYSSLLFKHNGGGGNYDYLIYNWGGRINVGGLNNNVEAFGAGSLTANTWTMIVWRHPNTLVSNRVTLRTSGSNTTNTVSIGALPTNNYTQLNIGTYFADQGSLCDVDWLGVWHRELSDGELDTLWNNGNTGTFA